MNKYAGMFCDKTFDCEAESEEEAQEKMRRELIEYLQNTPEPFLIWLEQ